MDKPKKEAVVRQENCRIAGASAGLAPSTIGRIGRSAHIHFFLLAQGWPGATLVTVVILAILATLAILIILPPKTTIFLLTIIITIAKISYITAIFI